MRVRAAFLVFVIGCSGGSGPADAARDTAADTLVDADVRRMYATVAWRVRCPEASCADGCAESADHVIDNFADEGGTSISCSVEESSGQRVLNFRLGNTAGQSVAFEAVSVPRAGGSATSGTVRVLEGGVEFSGRAGGMTPSAMQPCQVSNISFFAESETRDPTVRGYFVCQGMLDADMRACRDLSTVGGSAAATDPAEFTIYDCAGLEI